MISQIDILSQIASFMPIADNLVNTIATAYCIPPAKLQNMHITTTSMQLDPICICKCPSLLTLCPNDNLKSVIMNLSNPEVIAEYIITQDDSAHNFKSIVTSLYENTNWRSFGEKWSDLDESYKAIMFLNECYNETNQEHAGYDDELMMKKMCRYDAILQAYVYHHRFHQLENIHEYFHGRSLIHMFRLIRECIPNVLQLVRTCKTIEDLELFVTEIVADGAGYLVEYIIEQTTMGNNNSTRIRYIYERSLEE